MSLARGLPQARKKSKPVRTGLNRNGGEPMATLDDLKDPYWCASWNRGCAFLYREGFLCKVRILDSYNQPLPAEEYEVIEQISPAEGRPDSKLPPLLEVHRDRCCPRCQDQSLLWRTAARQLPRRSWQAVLCGDCYCRLVKNRSAPVRRKNTPAGEAPKCTAKRT